MSHIGEIILAWSVVGLLYFLTVGFRRLRRPKPLARERQRR